jgi:hypothetical protein
MTFVKGAPRQVRKEGSMIKLLCTAVAISFIALPAMATDFGYRHDDHRRVESHRSGGLSPFEARRLERERRYIVAQRRAALSDGWLSGRERHYLRELETQHRRNVWRERRD